MHLTEIHQQVIVEISKLNEPQIQLLLDFIKTIQTQSNSTELDPLANFVGAIEQGNLAEQIDHNLYE
jgi:hypothetical protein